MVSILTEISNMYTIESQKPPASKEEIQKLIDFSPIELPKDYLELLEEATEIYINVKNGSCIRIWELSGLNGVIELNKAYEVQEYIPKSLVIGDDGGDTALIYLDGKEGFGLYAVGFGALVIDEAVKISPSLRDLLVNNVGIENFQWDD